MKAVIVAYQGSHKTRSPNHMILQAEGVETKEQAEKLKGKSVAWVSPAGKKMLGIITQPHGRNGAVRAIFNPGLPGQALGTRAEVQ